MQETTSLKLESPLRFLKGVGPEREKAFARIGLKTVLDLFHYYPRRYENRAPVKPVREAVPGEKECVQGSVTSKGFIRTRGGPGLFRLVLGDAAGGALFGTWFNMPYLSNVFKTGSQVALYGRVEREGRNFKMTHPEYEIVSETPGTPNVHIGRIVPVYPLTEDLRQKGLRQLQFNLHETQSHLVREYLPSEIRDRLGLVDEGGAVRQIHFPDTIDALEAARRRLVFDEFFLMQTVIQMKKAKLGARAALAHAGGAEEVKALTSALDFELTVGQKSAIRDILADMKKPRAMNRLVQGDVGSGKTVVAAAALAFTAANGFQGAFMAPTEVLAQQQFLTLVRLLEPLGFRCAYLAQDTDPKARAEALAAVRSGAANVVVGTHAVIQAEVQFANLGLAVIDEQHKFGVVQRSALQAKAAGKAPHLLLMTATPIPRSLAMTLYGDLDLSTIAELPKGRRPVKTLWAPEEKRVDVYALVESLLDRGRQAYVICPLVENSSGTARSAVDSHAELSRIFAPRKVGLLHGRMKAEEKNAVMADFKSRKIELLVSTVVVEVGVDVPNASVMIVENAERFGLAQLHQLRGRVGRGSEESFCVLFSDSAVEISIDRLRAFEETESGFDIAEKDLELRGSGDLVGERQHGLPELRIGHLAHDIEILALARREAGVLVSKDPKLTLPVHAPILAALKERFSAPKEKLETLA